MENTQDLPVPPCVCGEQATWFLLGTALRRWLKKPAEELSASDVFEDLCEDCFSRAVASEQRHAWVRRLPAGHASN